MARKQAYSEVGAVVGMHAKTVERLVLHERSRALQLPARYAGLRRLGLDEQSHRPGKKHIICLLTNLETGTLVDILSNRKKETLLTYFQGLGQAFCQQITPVSCDIWPPYLAVAATCFPQATLVLDRFQVVKLLNQGLDGLRRRLRREGPGGAEEAGHKQLKWLLFKQYYRLSDAGLDALQAAFAGNAALKTACFLREQFHPILDRPQGVASALTCLDEWVASIRTQQLTLFDTFTGTLQRHKNHIANQVLDHVSNAVTDGLNNLCG